MIRRLPLLAIALASMAYGAWLGLVRIGWNLPLPQPDRLIAHGPLMICGFLGTLISLERAVALRGRWGYAAPILTAAGALAAAFGSAERAGPLLFTIGSGVTVVMLAVVWRRQPSVFAAVMMAGAAAWAIGNAMWLAGFAIFRVVFWWVAFLVLTIAGERLELNRVLRPTPAVQRAFVFAAAVIVAGAAAAVGWPSAGVRVMGAGLIAMTWWLARHDVARRTVRQHGLTRFMAVCLLSGYAWLGFGGAVAVVTGISTTGLVYDALLHAVFVGFVVSMVFAHAPVIFPAVLGVPLGYSPSFYAHAGLLHASLTVRVIGDLVDVLGRWRVWGGLLNAVTLLVFMLSTARAIAAASQRGSE